jgi:hypothetical protein
MAKPMFTKKEGLHMKLVEGMDKIAERKAVGDGEFKDDEGIKVMSVLSTTLLPASSSVTTGSPCR